MKLLIFQIALALLTSLVCGWGAQRLGQARVIGEMVGGILIGPSVFGRVAPEGFARVFPTSSLGLFEALSTVGLILFMFLIGSEVNYEHLRRERVTAALASLGSIVLPFGLAVAAAPMLRERFAPSGVGAVAFALFLGIAMSITAFPVLNTRGLVELVVLNIAYVAGVFSATLFTMMVVMALVTRMMTVPLLNWLGVGEKHGSAPVVFSKVA